MGPTRIHLEGGKRVIDSHTMEAVSAAENGLPDSWVCQCGHKRQLPTRTALASVGHPANSPAATMTRLKTCAVVGRRDASTTDALSAEVSDSEEDRLCG